MRNINIYCRALVLILALAATSSCVEKTSSSDNSSVAARRQASLTKKKAQANQMRTPNGKAKEKAYFAKINTINKQSLKSTQQPIIVKGSHLIVGGWGRSALGPAKEIFVNVGQKSFRANYGLNSSYLGTSLSNNKFNKCGFSSRIPVAQIGKGNHIVSVKVITDEGESIISDHKVRVEI